MAATEPMRFHGPCPFLLCLERGPHEHEICEDCGAVGHGNITCPTCRAWHSLEIPEFEGVPTQAPAGPAEVQSFIDAFSKVGPGGEGSGA